MKSLKEIIAEYREFLEFLRSFRTESIKSGRIEDFDYLKEILKHLGVTKQSGFVSEEVVGDYAGRRPIDREIVDDQIGEQIQRLLNYSPNQSFADNRGRPYVDYIYFEHTKRRGKDFLEVSFTWQSMGKMDVYSHYRLYLEGIIEENMGSFSRPNEMSAR